MATLLDTVKQITQTFPQTEAPLGVAVRYEPEYELIEQEIAKLSGWDPDSVQWRQIVQSGAQILTTKSKDLTIAVYLCMGWYVTEGVAGLSAGLEILDWMTSTQWEGIFPEAKRMRGRIAALQWLSDMLEKEVPLRKCVKKDLDHARSCAERMHGLSERLVGLLGGDAPSFLVAARALKTIISGLERDSDRQEKKKTITEQSAELPAARDEPAVANVEPAPEARISAIPVSGAGISTASDVPKALRNVQDQLRQIASILISQKLEDVRPYRFMRIAAWINIDALPPGQNGVTGLRPPSNDVLAKIRGYEASGDYRNLIIEVESSIGRAPFWLDGHQIVHKALGQLGAGFNAAREVVNKEITRFLERMPGVLDLKFNDETPFAGADTRAWLEKVVSLSTATGSTAPALVLQSATASLPPDEDDLEIQAARELIAQGKFKEGIEKLSAAQLRTGAARSRMLIQMAQARFCLEQQRADLSLPKLEALEQEFYARELEEWEPDLARNLLTLLLFSYEKVMEGNKKLGALKANRIQELFAKLCRLDLSGALEMQNRPTFKRLLETTYEM